MKCHLLLGDWLSGRVDMAPDISECTCGFWSLAVVARCVNLVVPTYPPIISLMCSTRLFFFKFLRLIPVLRHWVVCCGHRVGVLLVVGVGGGYRPPMLCVAQNHRLQGSPPLLSDLDILCEMEHEGPADLSTHAISLLFFCMPILQADPVE